MEVSHNKVLFNDIVVVENLQVFQVIVYKSKGYYFNVIKVYKYFIRKVASSNKVINNQVLMVCNSFGSNKRY